MLVFFKGSLAAITAAVLVAACGGSGSSTPTTTISGSAVKGPVDGATVTVKDASGNVLGTTTTNSTGGYTINISYSGDVVVEVNGGSYTDEATGAKTTLSTPLKVVLAVGGGNVTGMVTPLTTMAFNSATTGGAKPSSANFKSVATSLAGQFKLTGVDLATTLPTVTGSPNDYGKVLAAVSKYLQLNSKALSSLVGAALSNAEWTAFSGSFSSAYTAANGGSPISFSFDGTAFSIAGTGAGGGSGTCGVSATGSVSGIPVNFNYCVTGIAAGSCTAGNTSLSSALSGVATPGVSLTYTYSATCAAGATTIALK
jgi:hypothetical protein